MRRATSFALVLALSGSGRLAGQGQEKSPKRSPQAGRGGGDRAFEFIVPGGGRLVSLQVNVGPSRFGSDLVRGLKVVSADAAGKEAEGTVGPCDGKWQAAIAVPAERELVGVSGRHGLLVDSIRLHFSDGSVSPGAGGPSGDQDFRLLLARKRGKYVGRVRGLYGTSGDDGLNSLGLLLEGGAQLASAEDGLVLTIRGGVDPEFAPTVGRLTALFYEGYPRLLERFDNPKKPASRQITLMFKQGLRVPAFCSGAQITVSTDWLTRHPEDVALLTHELTHAVQAYPVGEPGWLIEGIADYARHLYGPKEQAGWRLPERLLPRHSYKDSYRVTARFLVWLDQRHPGTVDKLHRRLQDREFALDDFRTFTGKTVDALWQECVRELGKE